MGRQPRPVTPTSEAGIIEVAVVIDGDGDGGGNASGASSTWWKLITLAGQSNYYLANSTQVPGTDPCLAGTGERPVK